VCAERGAPTILLNLVHHKRIALVVVLAGRLLEAQVYAPDALTCQLIITSIPYPRTFPIPSRICNVRQ
jgi:hypothetical protein